MTERALLLVALAAGCADGSLATLGGSVAPFFVISGPVDPAAGVSGDHTRAAVAWVTWDDGSLSATVQEVPFEPRVLEYALSVIGPPEPVPPGVTYAPLEGAEVSVSWGLPMLVEGRGTLDVEVDAERLADWVLGVGTALDGALVGVGESEVAAVTAGHVLAVLATGRGGSDLADLPGWIAGGPACRADAVVAGLTLYRADDLGCDGWQPIARPGERTEFQGIGMMPVP